MKKDKSRYAARGVSSGKEGVHKATEGLEKGLFPGAFCSIFPDEDDPTFGNILHADGAGTKAGLAYLAQRHGKKESFTNKVWAGIAQDSLVMNIDDVACVGAVNREIRVSQIVSRNTFRISAEVTEVIIAGCKNFCDKMNQMGFKLLYTGGETQDVPDLTRTIAVDNAVSVRMKLASVIDAGRMVPGDVIIGFSSTGRARWEDEPNSGIGSNGLTNARHDGLAPVYSAVTESYAPEMDKDLVYRGKYRLEDALPGDKRFTIGSALLSPTRTYLPLIGKLLELISPKDVHGLIHCSGGGQTKIGKFGCPGNVYVKDNLFPVPPLFTMLQKVRRLPWKEMYASYNMGHRLEAVVPRKFEDACFKAATWAGLEARCVGRVVQRLPLQGRIFIKSINGEFTY